MTSLAFCPYNGTVCCDSAADLLLQKQYKAMNISDPGCASLLKWVLCSRCDQFSAKLFRINSVPRPVPVLCKSTVSANYSQSNQARDNFCGKVWDTCQNVSITSSPFAASLQGQTRQPINSNFSRMCLEKIGNGSYLSMAAHPDGSGHAFFSNQPGKIWLATIPKEGSEGTLVLDESNPFLDLTDEVHFDIEFGMMSIAFHPNFTQNGRFFASFNCDKVKWPKCVGRCSCNSDVNCDPSKLPADNGSQPCQYQSVVAEFTINGNKCSTGGSETDIYNGPSIYISSRGTDSFRPADGYLHFMMGDGGGTGDPFNFTQNKKSLLGKIIRLDVDNIPNFKWEIGQDLVRTSKISDLLDIFQ